MKTKLKTKKATPSSSIGEFYDNAQIVFKFTGNGKQMRYIEKQIRTAIKEMDQ